MSCLLQDSSGELAVNMSRGSEGCWRVKARLLWSPKGASLQGDEKRTKLLTNLRAVCVVDTETGERAPTTPPQGEERTRPLSEAELRTIVRRIVEAVERTPADRHRCAPGRRAPAFVELGWRCGNGPTLRASLDESECVPHDEPPKTGPVYRIIEVVARALEAQ
jgi:hypothetical protein